MSGFQFNPEEAEDEFEFSESGAQWTGRGSTIFLIDASPQMFQRSSDGEDEDSPFVKALRCAHSTVARKIIANDQDLYGIVLFNTTQSKNALDFANIYVLQDLNQPGAERMLELEELLQDGSGKAAVKKYGKSEDANIHEVLWVCRNIFIGSKKNLLTKNVLWFTCEDDPHATDEHKQRQAIKGAKDLKEGGIDIEILPLADTFNPEKFYKELLTQGGEDEDDSESLSVLANPSSRFEELLERVRRLEHKQRTMGKVSFSLAPGVEMGVKVFTAIRKAMKSRKVSLYKVTNEEVLSQRKEYLENGELLMPSDFIKYQAVAGKKIKFTLDEIKSISRIYEPGIELLGFKPLSSFKPDLYIKPANFIYPDESSVKGSSKLFACLLERCLERRVCPVVRVIAREGSSVSWAFLLPQDEVKDDRGCQERPPGFSICYLPFADDFRSVEVANRTRAQPDQVDAAKEVLKKLHFKYHPDCFENPDLQTHWRNIEALALNREYLEPVKDYTVPDHEGIEKKAGNLIDKFKALVLPPSYDPDVVAKKRPAPSASANPAPKKPKADKLPANVEEMAQQRKADKLTVDTLKQWLQERGVRVTGKRKPQLVQDVYDELHI